MKKEYFAPKPHGRPKCITIGCQKPAVHMNLCIRCERLMEQIDARFGVGHFVAHSCLPDKMKELIVDKTRKITKYINPRHRDDDE